MTVVIGCQNHLFAEGIKKIVEEDSKVNVVGLFDEARDYLEIVKLKPDLFILDTYLLSELEEGQSIQPGNRLLVIGEKSLYASEERISNLVYKGVVGIMPPASTAELLKKAIKAISEGELWLDRKIMSRIIDSKSHLKKEEIHLSKTEKEVVSLICQGFRNKEIAVKLNISEQTVKSHCNRAFKKVRVTDRLQLAVQAYKYWPELVFQKPNPQN